MSTLFSHKLGVMAVLTGRSRLRLFWLRSRVLLSIVHTTHIITTTINAICRFNTDVVILFLDSVVLAHTQTHSVSLWLNVGMRVRGGARAVDGVSPFCCVGVCECASMLWHNCYCYAPHCGSSEMKGKHIKKINENERCMCVCWIVLAAFIYQWNLLCEQ